MIVGEFAMKTYEVDVEFSKFGSVQKHKTIVVEAYNPHHALDICKYNLDTLQNDWEYKIKYIAEKSPGELYFINAELNGTIVFREGDRDAREI